MTHTDDLNLIEDLTHKFPAIPRVAVEAAYAFALMATVLGDEVPGLIRAGDATMAKKATAASVELKMIAAKIAEGVIGVERVGEKVADVRSYKLRWPGTTDEVATVFPDAQYVVGTLMPLPEETAAEIDALVAASAR